MDWLLPIFLWCCIHILIQSSSFYCDIHKFSPWIHWIKEHLPILSIHHTSHSGLTLWKYVGRKLGIRFGAPPQRGICSRTRCSYQASNNFPTKPQIQNYNHVDEKLTDHWCKAQVKGLQDFIHLKQPRWWNYNYICHCKYGAPWNTRRILRYQDKTRYHEDVSFQAWYPQIQPKNCGMDEQNLYLWVKLLRTCEEKLNLYSTSSLPVYRDYMVTSSFEWEEDKDFTS